MWTTLLVGSTPFLKRRCWKWCLIPHVHDDNHGGQSVFLSLFVFDELHALQDFGCSPFCCFLKVDLMVEWESLVTVSWLYLAGNSSEHESDKVGLEVQIDTAELELPGGDESGTAELDLISEDDPIPIPHQSKTLGTEDLLSYPSNSGRPFGLAGGDLRYPAPLGTTLLNVGLCPGLKKLAKVISKNTPQPPKTAHIAPEAENRVRLIEK